jgi:transcriptional regulator with XRE-family HTH domain
VADKIDKGTKRVLAELGAHLRQVREAREIPQAQLAHEIKMEPTNLAKIERGEKNVTVDTLVRIANGLDVELVVKLVTPRKRGA